MSAERKVEFDQLSVAEQVLYVQDLWDRIRERAEQAELTDAERDELDRRLDAYEKGDEAETVAWEALRDRLQSSR